MTAGCSKPGKVEATSGGETKPTVAVARAKKEDLSRALVLTAEFRPFQEVDVMAKVAGYVKKISVDVGDRVKQGQLLAVLEIPEMADDITKANASLQRARAEVARSREELTRAQAAHEMNHLAYTRLEAVSKTRPGIVAQQEIDDAHSRDLVGEAQIHAATSAVDAAEEAVKFAEADRARSNTLYEYARVTAPFGGVITRRFADTGSMIQAGTASQTQAMPLVRLSQNDLLRLMLPVPESAVPVIRLGTVVEVGVPSLSRSFPGRVARFSDKVATTTRTMDTEVDVPNAGLILVPGMYAEARLTLDKRSGVLSIPLTAIGGSDEKPAVFVVNAGQRIEQRQIRLGLETSDRAEMLSGLQEGDLVVVGNRSQLHAGELVTPKVVELNTAPGGA
jgi:RND family efflux transporter MFP subunit